MQILEYINDLQGISKLTSGIDKRVSVELSKNSLSFMANMSNALILNEIKLKY